MSDSSKNHAILSPVSSPIPSPVPSTEPPSDDEPKSERPRSTIKPDESGKRDNRETCNKRSRYQDDEEEPVSKEDKRSKRSGQEPRSSLPSRPSRPSRPSQRPKSSQPRPHDDRIDKRDRRTRRIVVTGREIDRLFASDFFQIFSQFGIVVGVDRYEDEVYITFDTEEGADRAVRTRRLEIDGMAIYATFGKSDRYRRTVEEGRRPRYPSRHVRDGYERHGNGHVRDEYGPPAAYRHGNGYGRNGQNECGPPPLYGYERGHTYGHVPHRGPPREHGYHDRRHCRSGCESKHEPLTQGAYDAPEPDRSYATNLKPDDI